MVVPRPDRRLAAILVLDVVGYSRLMERGDAGTLERLKAAREGLVEPLLARHRGRIVKLTGDGALCEFGSVVDAVEVCPRDPGRGSRAGGGGRRGGAVPVPHRHQPRRRDRRRGRRSLRRWGERRRAPGAARRAGRHRRVRRRPRPPPGRARLRLRGPGRATAQEHRPPGAGAFRVVLDGAATARGPAAPPLPDKPSLAVLPFANMGGDPAQEYLADGITEELTTTLARCRWLFVAARNSSFAYKGRPVDVRRAGRELGVRYVLQGSVRACGRPAPDHGAAGRGGERRARALLHGHAKLLSPLGFFNAQFSLSR